MKTKIRTLIATRDLVDGIDGVLSCVGVAVTARPLQSNEMDGVLTILQWTGQRLGECSKELSAVIDQLDRAAPN